MLSITNDTLINRKTLRQRRQAISSRQQRLAAAAISLRLNQLAQFQRARRIAYYLANDGEISPSQAIDIVKKRGKLTYLPVLHPLKYNRLYFSRHHHKSKLRRNRFGIEEPQFGKNPIAPIWTLDIVLLPLVGFDRSGNRLGMGGGFYDRTLAQLNNNCLKQPLLIGLAHQCQEVAHLETQNWDIPLDIIATDHELIHINKNPRHPANRRCN